MNQVTTALSADEIAAIEARSQFQAPTQPEAVQSSSVSFSGSANRIKTVQLEWPIEVDGRTITSVELRRLVGRDFQYLRSLPAGADENAELLSRMTGLSVDLIGELDGDDYANLSEAARAFLPRKMVEAIASETGGQ